MEHSKILQRIPLGAEKVLEIGCGIGELSKKLKKRGIQKVVGIEIDSELAQEAKKNIDQIFIGDVENLDLPFNKGYFDVLIFIDILEYLHNPKEVLRKYIHYLSDEGTIVLNFPNIRYFGVLNDLVERTCNYQYLDNKKKDNLRYFTYKEILDILNLNGYSLIIDELVDLDCQYLQLNLTYPANINFGRVSLKKLNEVEYKDLFVHKYLFTACKKIPFLFSQEVINEFSTYTGLSFQEIKERCKNVTAQQNKEWQDICGEKKTPEKITEFYKTTDSYLFDLFIFNYDNFLYLYLMREIRKFCTKLVIV